MSKIKKGYISFGTGTNDVQASVIPANLTPSNYTPSTTDIKGHLQGIDTALAGAGGGGPYDLTETSYTKTSGVASALTNEVITGFIMPEANVRAFEGLIYAVVASTATTYQVFKITGIMKATGNWFIDVLSTGDNSGVTLDILSSSSNGQIVYNMAADASRTSVSMKFRAQALQI